MANKVEFITGQRPAPEAGSLWLNDVSGEVYIVCRNFSAGTFQMHSLADGSRWSSPVKDPADVFGCSARKFTKITDPVTITPQ